MTGGDEMITGTGQADALPTHGDRAEEAFDGGDFFALRDMLDADVTLSPRDRAFYTAVCESAFGRTSLSEHLIDAFLRDFAGDSEPEYIYEILKVRADNMLRNCRYGQAAGVYRHILGSYGHLLEPREREDVENSLALWSPLQEVAPQRLVLYGDASIAYKRTVFNHITVGVESGGQTADFLFDTGANLSAVTESWAARMGMHILETDVKVVTATGGSMRSRLAVAPRFSVGGLEFSNAVFLLLRDEELDFGELDYRIEGVVGLPLIRQMREVRIGRERITVPARLSPPGERNLCFEGMMPILAAYSEGHRMLFTFDTGANRTELSHRYWSRNRERIEAQGSKVSGKRAGGGGVVDVDSYELQGFPLRIGGRDIRLPRISVSLEPYLFNEHKDGNLGLDALSQLGDAVISFAHMSVTPGR